MEIAFALQLTSALEIPGLYETGELLARHCTLTGFIDATARHVHGEYALRDLPAPQFNGENDGKWVGIVFCTMLTVGDNIST